MTDDQFREVIATEVAPAVQRSMPEKFGSIKTDMIDLFDDRYAALSKVFSASATTIISAARISGGRGTSTIRIP